MNKNLILYMLIFSLFLIPAISFSQTTSLSAWLSNNSNIKYITTNYNISQITKTFFNGSFYEIQNHQYYSNSTIYQNQNTSTNFYVAENAYPFNFIANMYNDNSSYCSSIPYNGNITSEFFSTLCQAYKSSINSTMNVTGKNKTEIDAELKTLATEYMADDNFTKQLYNLYESYSSSCINPSSTIDNSSLLIQTYCSGTASNYSLPNPLQFSAFYQSLYTFMQDQKISTANITKLMIYYDINHQSIFPTIKNSKLIQPNIAILGVYPGVLPSGQQAENISNNATLIIPIYMTNNFTKENFNKTGIHITSGLYNNVSLFVGVQTKFNNYAVYNLSTAQSPFEGNQTSPMETYHNSCYASNPGESAVENSEINSNKNSIFSGLYSVNLYPKNSDLNYMTGNQALHYSNYGSSIIKATYSNLKTPNAKLIYGTEIDGIIIYKNSKDINAFSNQTNIYNFTLPKMAFPYKNEKIFVKLESPFSYSISYSQFTENIGSPTYKYNNYHYTIYITKYIKVTKTIGNKTITYKKAIQVPKTCYVNQVQTSMKYNATENHLATKNYNENVSNYQKLSISTNLTTQNIFKYNNANKTASLNYKFNFTDVKLPNGNYNSYSSITVPLATAFQVTSPNGTVLTQFDTYNFSKELITNNYNSFYTTISKSLFSYDPAFVYVNNYATVPVLYPTIENVYNNGEYLQQFGGEAGTSFLKLDPISGGGMYAAVVGLENVIGTLSGTTKTNFGSSIVLNNINEYKYYQDGCSATKEGNYCIIRSPLYTMGQSPNSNAKSYDLLNPTLFTQNAFYAGTESPEWLCMKGSFYSLNLLQTISCEFEPNVNNINNVFIDTDELNFNTSFFGLNGSYKNYFYGVLENNTIKNESNYPDFLSSPYSYIQPPDINNPAFSSTKTYNSNGTITLNYNSGFSSLSFSECNYNLCFTKILTPTTGKINSYYTYSQINSSSYLFYIQPNIAYFSYNSSSTPIKLFTNGKNFTTTVGKAFIISYKNGNSTSESQSIITFDNTSMPLITLTSNSSIWQRLEAPNTFKISIGNYNFTSNNYTFIGLTQNIKFMPENDYNNLYYYLAIIIIFIDLFYFTGEFNKMKLFIKSAWEKAKREFNGE